MAAVHALACSQAALDVREPRHECSVLGCAGALLTGPCFRAGDASLYLRTAVYTHGVRRQRVAAPCDQLHRLCGSAAGGVVGVCKVAELPWRGCLDIVVTRSRP